MPDFIPPTDKCPCCGQALTWPPRCCWRMDKEYVQQNRAEWEGCDDDEEDFDYEE